MQPVDWENVQPGELLPAHVCGPISRWVLAMFGGGSGDPNPIHVDLDFVRSVGMQDVIAHGMLSMAYAGQLLTRWVPQEQIRSFQVRFTAITPVLATVRCTATVREKYVAEGENRIRLDIRAHIDGDIETLAGEAVIGFPPTPAPKR